MSKSILSALSLVLVLAAAAHAGVPDMSRGRPNPGLDKFQTVCSNAGGDTGYIITVQDGVAEVQENKLTGAELVAKLTCPQVKKAPCCDQVTTTVCVDEQTRSANDTGYTLTLSSGGFAGGTRAVLNHGRAAVARMACRVERAQ